MAKGIGLAVIAGIGVAVLASSGSGGSSPRPLPAPPKPTGPDEEIPRDVLTRIATAVASQDPAKLRAEAKQLRKEGYTAQAKALEEFADELEAKAKPAPSPSAPPPAPPAPPAPGAPVRDLVRGMKGEDVRTWQKQLIADGYANLAADADFGQLTYAATTEWQWERELKDDGIVGKNTRAAIGTPPKRKRPAAKPPAPAPAPVKPAPAPSAPVKPPAPPAPNKPPVAPLPPGVPTPPPTVPQPPAPKPPANTIPGLLVNVTLRRVPDSQPADNRVVAWQDQLKKLGHRPNVKSDGKFGANTESQTKALQKAKQLSQTGVADPTTIAAAYGAKAPKPAPTPAPAPKSPAVPPLNVNLATWRSVLQKGNKGNDVREWQQVLARYGFEVTPDGDFGNLTHTASIAWQTAYARFNDGRTLVPDGKVGKNTRDRIVELEATKQIVAGELASMPTELLTSLATPFAPGWELVPAPEEGSVHALALELVQNLEATAPGDEDRELVTRFQERHGLNATGSYGPATAEALIALGIVPPRPRYWPSKKLWRAQTRYRVALRQQAHNDPQRADEWLSAASAF